MAGRLRCEKSCSLYMGPPEESLPHEVLLTNRGSRPRMTSAGIGHFDRSNSRSSLTQEGTPLNCPVCNAESQGRFCSNCGAALTPISCPSCHSEAPAGARFCPHCGHSLGAPRNRGPAIAWIVAGATTAAVATVLIVRLTSPSSFTGSPAGAASGDLPASAVAAPDISNMSPRERADRLYNRVMTAAENMDSAQMRFFGPMAVQAYSLLGALDPDAHYHLGMIHLVSGEYAAAASQADSISRASPSNLLATALNLEIAKKKGDKTGTANGYRRLVANFEREMGTGNADYADHRAVLDRLRNEARSAGIK